MQEPPRFPREAWLPLIAGLGWLWVGAQGTVLDFFVCLVPGILLLASGVAELLWAGDRRIAQFAALGGVLGVLLGLPGIFFVGLGSALVLMALSAAAFLAAGAISVRQEPAVPHVPAPEPSLGLAAAVALDEALLATMGVSLPMPRGHDLERIASEVDAARELYSARGWLEKPESFHQAPMPLEAPQLKRREVRTRHGRLAFEHLSYESEYEPHPEEPGRERWLSYVPNRQAHAWVLRHRDEQPRPWLLCVHGYQMGSPTIDFGAFPPRDLHERLGMNLLLPVLPLHGPRKIGRRSGDGFISASVLDSVHAEAQAMWELRRLVGWARQQGAPSVGIYGLSLGGYTTALFAGLCDELACAIPGIPATDFAHLYWRHGPDLQIEHLESNGVVHDEVAEVLHVVSPFAFEPKVPHEHRAIFGGVADRLVPAEGVHRLWEHWERPEIVWYQGSHLTFPREPRVGQMVDRQLRDAGLAIEA